jgi:hypothetical protein
MGREEVKKNEGTESQDAQAFQSLSKVSEIAYPQGAKHPATEKFQRFAWQGYVPLFNDRYLYE